MVILTLSPCEHVICTECSCLLWERHVILDIDSLLSAALSRLTKLADPNAEQDRDRIKVQGCLMKKTGTEGEGSGRLEWRRSAGLGKGELVGR